jgi:hypothetical protein
MNKIKSTQKQCGSFTDVTATLDSWQWRGGSPLKDAEHPS